MIKDVTHLYEGWLINLADVLVYSTQDTYVSHPPFQTVSRRTFPQVWKQPLKKPKRPPLASRMYSEAEKGTMMVHSATLIPLIKGEIELPGYATPGKLTHQGIIPQGDFEKFE